MPVGKGALTAQKLPGCDPEENRIKMERDQNGTISCIFRRFQIQIGADRPLVASGISKLSNSSRLSTLVIYKKVAKKAVDSCIPESFVGNSSRQNLDSGPHIPDRIWSPR
jgi:hypothetical protein